MASCRVGGMRVWLAVGIVLGLALPGGTLVLGSPFLVRPAHSIHETSLDSRFPARDQPPEGLLGRVPALPHPASVYSVASTISLLNDTTYTGNRQFVNPVNPTEMTEVPSLGELFVSAGDANAISVLNSSTGRILVVIPVAPNPWYSTYVPQKHLLYVDSSTSSQLTIISTTNNTVVGTVALNRSSYGIAYDPTTGSLYVGSAQSGYPNSNGISIVNLTTNKMVGWVTTGGSLYDLQYIPANGMVYASDYGLGNVIEFDPLNQSVLHRWAVSPNPDDLAYDPYNQKLYIAGQTTKDVEVLNTSTNVWDPSIPAGTEPSGIAWDPVQQEIFTANDVSGDMTAINAKNDSVIAPSIPIGSSPWGAVYDPASGRVFGADFASSTVAAVDPSTLKVVADYQISAVPSGFVAETQDGRVYATDEANNTVVTLNGSTYLGKVVTGSQPRGEAFDPWNHDVFIANFGTNNLTVLDGATGRSINSWLVGSPASSLLYDPANDSLYDLYPFSSPVMDINVSTGAVQAQFQTDSTPTQATYDPGNNRVYISNQAYSNVTFLNASTGRLLGTITAGNPLNSLSQGIVYDPYDKEIYVANPNTNNLSVINTTSNRVVATLNLSGTPTDLAYDSATHQILVTRTAANEVTVLNATLLRVDYNVTVGLAPGPMAFQPYGNEIYVGNTNSGTVSVLSASGIVPSLSSVSVAPSSAFVAPNGTQPLTATPSCSGGPCPPGTTYAWSLTNSLGSLNSTTGNPVVFTAKTTPGNVTLYVNATLNGIRKPGNPVPITVNSSSTPALTSVSVSPTAPLVPVNSTQVFTATSTCTSMCPGSVVYSWTLNNTLGSVGPATGSTTTFTAGPASGVVRVTVAASLGGVTKWANATITITPVIPVLSSVSISPTPITVGVGNSTSFTAHPNCTGGTCPSGATYSWALNNTALGTISPTTGPTETFTAGNTAGSVLLHATASLNGVQQTGLAIINITKGTVPTLTGLTLTPSPTALVQMGKSLTFNAMPSCSVSTCPSGIAYTWVLNNSSGNLSSTSGQSVVFTAGSSAGSTSMTVTAQLNGGSKTATSDITITSSTVPVITRVTITPGSATVRINQGQGFTANATCSPGPCPSSTTYSWSLNNSLGSVSPSTGTSTQFTAGSHAGEVTLRVDSTYNGKRVTDSVVITISQSSTPPTNSTSPPTFLGLPGYDGYILLVVVAVVVVAAVVIALTRRKKAGWTPPLSTG